MLSHPRTPPLLQLRGGGDALAVDSRLLQGANWFFILAVSAAPLLSVDAVEPLCRLLQRVLPLLGALLARVLHAVSAAAEATRLNREKLFVLAHGMATYACGDVVAQTMGHAAPDAARGSTCLWEPSRTARAALVGLLSDTWPFYHWSKGLQSLDVARPPLDRSALLGRRPALLLPLKIIVHILTFQPASTAAYLFLTGLFRGGPADALALLRSTFVTAFIPAFASFTVGGALVYSLPSVALQAALRNAGVLGICIYLAVVSHR